MTNYNDFYHRGFNEPEFWEDSFFISEYRKEVARLMARDHHQQALNHRMMEEKEIKKKNQELSEFYKNYYPGMLENQCYNGW